MCRLAWSCPAGSRPVPPSPAEEGRFGTGGFPRASNMRPNLRRAVLQASVLAVLLLTLEAESQESRCRPDIRVRQNTVYEASLGERLEISCKSVFCNSSPPQISWYKDGSFSPISFNKSTHIKTKYEASENSTGTSYLTFENIITSDSGLYNCQGGGSVSHSINVSVSDHVGLTTVTLKYETTKNDTPIQGRDFKDTLWVYVILAAGIVVLVVLVIIISVVSMRGCKGKSRKEDQTQLQFIEIPMSQQPTSHPNLQRPPRGSPSSSHLLYSSGPESIYDNAPSRRPGRKNATPSDPDRMTGNDHVYGRKKEAKRKMEKAEEEEESHVLYAALNHQMLPGPSVQPPRPKEDSSEYAAIRVP